MTGWAASAEKTFQSIQVVSDAYVIDRVYRSMEGPGGRKVFEFDHGRPPELLWVTGGKVQVFDAVNKTKTTAMVCHANLRFDPADYKNNDPNAGLGHLTHQQIKLFSFVEGQPEILLPEGFGIPVMSDHFFEFNFGTMNPVRPEKPFSVKANGRFHYIRDNELEHPLKPLFMRIVSMKLKIEGNAPQHPANCPMGSEEISMDPVEESASPASQSLKSVDRNEKGYPQAYHWMVPAGSHTYRYPLEHQIFKDLPFDTTIHYINVHLHPHAEFIELRDLTTGQSLYQSRVENSPDRTAVTKFDVYSSLEGLPVHRDHEYELVCRYNNTTDHDVDAMALMFVYLYDKTFDGEKVRSAKKI